jgi:WD40 repeat protein
VKLWDLTRDPRGRSIPVVLGGGEFVGPIGFLPDNRHLCAVDTHERIHLGTWDLQDGSSPPRVTLDAGSLHPSAVLRHQFALSADGRRLAGIDQTNARAVHLWDTATGRQVGLVHGADLPVRTLALSADGRLLACCNWMVEGDAAHRTIRASLTVHDTASDRVLYTLAPEPEKFLAHPAFSADGRWLAAGKWTVEWVQGVSLRPVEAHPILWDARTGQEAAALEECPFGRVSALAFSPDGASLASVGLQDPGGQVLVHDTATGRLRYPALKTASFLTGVTYSPDGRRLAVNGYDGLIRFWDARTGKQLLTLRGFEIPGDGNYAFEGHVVFSPDGRRLAANGWHGTVSVWDCGTESRVR